MFYAIVTKKNLKQVSEKLGIMAKTMSDHQTSPKVASTWLRPFSFRQIMDEISRLRQVCGPT